MNRLIRLTVGAVAAASGLLATTPARAQTVMCNDATLPNPVIISGSTAFEATLRQFAAKLSAEALPTTIIFTQASTLQGSCNGVASIVSDTDLAGTQGRYYTGAAGATNNPCTFAAGQKAHVGISDVYYESCTNVPATKPAEIKDVTGPAQAMLFIVPKADTDTLGLTYKEAQLIYGCGVSVAQPIAGFADPAGIFCRDANSGTQITVAKNIGVPESVLVSPKCVNGGGTSGVGMMVMNYTGASKSLGFVAADYLEQGTNRTVFSALGFKALGQSSAYTADSTAATPDRKNVRDGHYGIWGYEHFIAKTTGGNLSTQASDLIGWFTGTKTSANFDYVTLEGTAGVIPQCAMKVKRSTDGGLMSPYTPAESCNCAFEAAISHTTPAGCTACSTATPCASGTCRHGFCE